MPQYKNELINTMISERFEVYHVKDVVAPEQTFYHSHDYYEIHCTLAGSGTFFLDGREFPLTPGSVLLIQQNDLHRILNQTSNFFERVYIFVTPQYLEAHSTPQTNLAQCFQTSGPLRSRLLQLPPEKLRELLAPLDQQPEQSYGADFFYEEKFLQLMVYFNRLVQEQEQPKMLKESPTENPLMTEVLRYIAENLASDLRQEPLSQRFFINKYALGRQFKAATGLTLHQYILKKRLLLSKQLLREQGSASQIFTQCGFTSYPHFLRCFKEEFHMTPKEFLEKEKKRQFVSFEHEG